MPGLLKKVCTEPYQQGTGSSGGTNFVHLQRITGLEADLDFSCLTDWSGTGRFHRNTGSFRFLLGSGFGFRFFYHRWFLQDLVTWFFLGSWIKVFILDIGSVWINQSTYTNILLIFFYCKSKSAWFVNYRIYLLFRIIT